MARRKKFKPGEAIVFDPKWWDSFANASKHPLKKGEVVYFLTEIPNVPCHCLVAQYTGAVVAMVHPEDFRKATDDEL